MKVGDLFEWIACAVFVAAGWFGTHRAWVALAIGGIALAYQGQCYGTTPVKLPRLFRRKP